VSTSGSGVCYSTHGGSGYTLGSYMDGEDVICGECGFRIKNPPPTGTINNKPYYGQAVSGQKV
jgi:hypothetical protein